MPTINPNPGDLEYIVLLQSTATTYQPLNTAIAAATTLSAANSNAVVHIAEIQEIVSGTGSSATDNVSMAGGGTQTYVVQLLSGTTYIPLEAARTAAYALSAANSSGAVGIYKVLPYNTTAP